MSKELPAHITALLQSQQRSPDGQPADSAGVPWEGRDLSGEGNPLHTFDGDDGLAPPALQGILAQLRAGEADETAVVNTLPGLRLFAPVIASLGGGQTHEDHAEVGDKEADISLVSLAASDGRRAMPVFSSVEALTAWHPEARPVAAEAERIMLAALAEGAELAVLDPGAEFTFVIRRPAVEALAQGRTWTPAYADHEVARALSEVPEQCPGVAQLLLQPSRGIVTADAHGARVVGGGSGPEVALGVVFDDGLEDVDQRLALAAVQASLADVPVLRERADSVEIIRAA
ncbi:SseB family protein [Nesterenkonia flava]|uniref:SseB family protein n=1 Tax=Nesterenkonia flava TaxID=469799 RepID=A0ABU1FTG4_9MICC|nr:SseB family protein [Nesterenkonia flava]MDR5711632.1 SseB family protein [Nesterenkonia flava]